MIDAGGEWPTRSRSPLRVGIVCPYSLDVPGGVQAHVVGLAAALERMGHTVSVLAPAVDSTPVPEFVTTAGRALGVPYNGSVARVSFGPVTYARARRWLADHTFDVLHLHEPTTFSLSVLALLAAEGPIVATFHTSTQRSRALSAFGGMLRPLMEKVTARIAVSPLARRVQVQHLGGDAVEIPNGVDVDAFADGPLLPGYPRPGTVGFLGRFDEQRKGMTVLLDAVRMLAPTRPDLRLLVLGRGDAGALRREAGPVADRLDVLGAVDDATKAAALRSMDVYCAPNLRGESFGIVLAEAMAAGAPVLASDLDAFRAVLGDSGAGVLFPTGDPAALAGGLAGLLDDPARQAVLSAAGRVRAGDFGWPAVAAAVVRVYRAAVAADPRLVGHARHVTARQGAP
jgi:phosphatidylinositol alpha-mannosyltransferase